MFDVGFSELIVIGIVALVVIGPERLPKVARTAGLLLGRVQRYVSDVKADISREMQLDELKKMQSDVQESARDFERSIAGEVQAIEQGVEQAVGSVKADMTDMAPASAEESSGLSAEEGLIVESPAESAVPPLADTASPATKG